MMMKKIAAAGMICAALASPASAEWRHNYANGGQYEGGSRAGDFSIYYGCQGGMYSSVTFEIPGAKTGHARIFIDGKPAATIAIKPAPDGKRTVGEMSYSSRNGGSDTARRSVNDMLFAIAGGISLEFHVDGGPSYSMPLKGSSDIKHCEATI